MCLVFHKCEKCEKIISVPESSDNCCVICEYADKKCPVGLKTNKERSVDELEKIEYVPSKNSAGRNYMN